VFSIVAHNETIAFGAESQESGCGDLRQHTRSFPLGRIKKLQVFSKKEKVGKRSLRTDRKKPKKGNKKTNPNTKQGYGEFIDWSVF
jgi:hypothetical protein